MSKTEPPIHSVKIDDNSQREHLVQLIADRMASGKNAKGRTLLEMYANAAMDVWEECRTLQYSEIVEHPTPDSMGSPTRYTDGSYSREYEEQAVRSEISVVAALESGIYHQAQDSEFDMGFNEAKRQALQIASQHSSIKTKNRTHVPDGEVKLILYSRHIACSAQFEAEGLPKDAHLALKAAEAILQGSKQPEPVAGSEGWFIPCDCMTSIAENTFCEMMSIIKSGGAVDVVARCDGKEYRWQCDGLKYAKRIGK